MGDLSFSGRTGPPNFKFLYFPPSLKLSSNITFPYLKCPEIAEFGFPPGFNPGANGVLINVSNLLDIAMTC